jgi:DNA ligase-1
MIRDPNGHYKQGRSTTKEGILLKIKAFEDEEATIIGVELFRENHNPQQRDALGHAKRSTAQAGKVAVEKLGALVCRFADGTEFSVGSGFTEEQRVVFWCASKHQDGISGIFSPVVKIKYQAPPGGRKPGEAPRFPVFVGFRED